jgi:hypothetical protein
VHENDDHEILKIYFCRAPVALMGLVWKELAVDMAVAIFTEEVDEGSSSEYVVVQMNWRAGLANNVCAKLRHSFL